MAQAAYIIPTPQPTATPANTPVPTATVVPTATPIPTPTAYTAYDTIQEEGVGVTQRRTLNMIGAYVTCADNTTKTDCTFVTPTPQPTPTAAAAGGARAWYGSGSATSTLSSASATVYLVGNGAQALDATAANVYTLGPYANGTFKNMFCRYQSTVSSGSIAITFNETSAITCTISSGTTCTDTSNTLSWTAGTNQVMRYKVVTSSLNPTGSSFSCSIEFVPS